MFITCVTSRYLPNLRHLARLCEVDRAVILDLAPLPHQNKNSFVSRNRICGPSGEKFWLSLPVRRKGVHDIVNAKIEYTQNKWIDKHIKNIARVYPNHKEVAGGFLESLEHALRESNGNLIDINMRSLRIILDTLELDASSIVMQSDIVESHDKEHRLHIAHSLGACRYIAGRVEWEVMKKSGCIDKMRSVGIDVYKTPELDARQYSPVDVETCSCLHAILTRGPEGARSLVQSMVAYLRRHEVLDIGNG
jgi:hypothetical protein